MSVNNKLFYANIQLINSIVKDENGNQISLTSNERLSVSHASGGPASQVNPLTTKTYVDGAIDAAVTSAVDGLSWRPPVDTVTSVEPPAPVEGMRYLNPVDGRIYTFKASTWTGVMPQANWAVYVKDTDEEFTYNSDTGEWVMKSAGAIPDATTEVKGKVVIGSNINVVNGRISVNDADIGIKGVVEFSNDGEVAALKAVQANDRRLLKGRFFGTYVGVTNFEVAHNLESVRVMAQVWKGGEIIEAFVARKTGSEASVLQIGLNQLATVDVVVIAIP